MKYRPDLGELGDNEETFPVPTFTRTNGIGYAFTPMMPFYVRWLHADTAWIESVAGRALLAKVVRHCRKQYGRERAIEFLDALTFLGCYPVMASIVSRDS